MKSLKSVLFITIAVISLLSLAFVKQKPEKMFKHIVCFKFKTGITEEARQKHIKYFASLKDSIPEIVSYEGGDAQKVGYENTADYDYVHIVTLKSKEDSEKYFHHPAHQRFIQVNKDSWANVFVINTEIEK